MEAKELIENFKAELTCSICLGYFTDPVTTRCGHNFCKDCLLQCYEQDDATLTCPECRGVIRYSDIVLSKNLQNLSITGKILRENLLSPALLTTCDQHGEKEKLFCEQDQKLICESCLLTEEHKDHQVLPLQMAADKYKKKLQETRNMLQRKKEEFKETMKKMRKTEAYFKEDTKFYKALIRYEYNKMHEFLYNEENQHLQKLDQEIEDKVAKVEQNKAYLSQQIQHLQRKILDLEENMDKTPLEMLQDMKDILKRNEELLFQEPEIIYLTYTTYPMTALTEILKSYTADITPDPETGSLHFIMPEHFKSLKYGLDPQDQSDKEERLEYFVTMLGTQTFTSGTHYWEVDVEGQTEWILGICRDSVSKNGTHSILSADVTAIIGLKVENQILFWSPKDCFYSTPSHKVGIFLNYDEGNITFYDVKEKIILISFPNLTFGGPVRPFFSASLFNKGSTL
ncbi:probable E3 ubiquitin-protein ligase TRIML1 [Gracilinanus agilis]|uniref:probable E3 ubiquitin-protein ligase TRIML1 n=1 Tax=Gracilinanus agilis TaxID=191870 RepID=UPI001CFC69AF|nr:probable E3 ubiquitin-protein ligase TRIML1 [Gracilinanus agilis]